VIKQQLAAGEQILFRQSQGRCFARRLRWPALQTEHELDEGNRWISRRRRYMRNWPNGMPRVSAYHADLSLAQRRLTERLFRTGHCASSLHRHAGDGVNLPASIIIMSRPNGSPAGMAARRFDRIEPREFDNAAGRAGRLSGRDGRAICAPPPRSRPISSGYIAAASRGDNGTLQWPEAERRILEAVVCGLVAKTIRQCGILPGGCARRARQRA
jgi:hypothetical protein